MPFTHESAVTNSMHLQSTHTPHLQYFESEAHLKSSLTSAVVLFRINSERVKAVGYFRRRATSYIFDRVSCIATVVGWQNDTKGNA